jgi:hypothetical protein
LLRRTLIAVAVLVAALSVAPFAAAAIVHIRVEGKTVTIFGSSEPRVSATTPLVVVAAAALLAGCGGSGPGHGTATLWLTRDEGKTVLLVRSVPADETVLQALERSTKLTTRYGGRFVQSVNGISGSITSRHDWFYFVNGVEGDRSAADYRLRSGDIAWWDYRDWGRSGMSVPIVVGAFPEPFIHGYNGKARATIVLGPKTAAVRRIARLVHAQRIAPAATTRVRGDRVP